MVRPANLVNFKNDVSKTPITVNLAAFQARERSRNMMRCVGLFVCAGLSVLIMGCDSYDPYHPDTSNRVGIWALDNTLTRNAEERPVSKRLMVYQTHMEFCPGQGTVGIEGHWRDGGFWGVPKDGSQEIEVAKVTSPEHLELSLAAFYPGNSETLDLYKEEGSDEERKEVAARYATPYTYPPPFGVITEGMSEYELRMLPWKADKIEPSPYTTGEVIYHFHSDTPGRGEMEVTVRDHVVMRTSGGNA